MSFVYEDIKQDSLIDAEFEAYQNGYHKAMQNVREAIELYKARYSKSQDVQDCFRKMSLFLGVNEE